MKRNSALAAITLLFAGTITGAWAWFHVAPPEGFERLRFDYTSQVEGWTFESEPLSDVVIETLATTNLVNGSFTTAQGDRITVFAAEWRAADNTAMSVVQHTPDICWVGIGLTPVDLGQPDRVPLKLADREFPFECRVFSAPGAREKELVIWCTLLAGQVMEESERWRIEEDASVSSRQRFYWATRRLAVSQLVRNVLSRRRATGHKQFVRLSLPFHGDWNTGLNQLRAFAPLWLRVGEDPEQQATAPNSPSA